MKQLIILVILFYSLAGFATGLKTENETKSLCDKASSQFGAGHVKESFNTLKQHWPLPEEEINNLIYKTESQLQMVDSRFGALLGSDYISTQKAGNSFIKYTYVIKYQKHALRYMCIFYKPNDFWVLNAVTWDDETKKLFE